MDNNRVFVTGLGIISPLGQGFSATVDSLKSGTKGIRAVSVVPVAQSRVLPVGECESDGLDDGIPRTHALAINAARQAMKDHGSPPDAIIIGTTTGGMIDSEAALKENDYSPGRYTYQSSGSVAELLARELNCTGPLITVSTACSSGTAVLKLALELLRTGQARTVLAGGADSLCRLTYYGFNSLQLLDPQGARPFDKDRKGMSVAEGAAMLLLCASEEAPPGAYAEITGAGLSCDAHHPAAPHPDGEGAVMAMKKAMEDAGIAPGEIDYINLHGTGTKENDASEAKAVRSLFTGGLPSLSSIKGATGHTLAAAGAIEAVVSCCCIRDGFVPANIGYASEDPGVGFVPLVEQLNKEVNTVLSNSFGFGGNNAAVVISRPRNIKRKTGSSPAPRFRVLGSSCFSGAGDRGTTLEALQKEGSAAGLLPLEVISEKLPQRSVRRLKRLPRIALSLAVSVHESAGGEKAPDVISFGTAWGALSETNDFLMKLYETDEEFTSPTDFVGSVHNAPAGQVAIWLKATGPNMTVTGGDFSFEQALMTAGLICGKDETALVMAADEYHKTLSDIFDPSVVLASEKSDGGGAFMLQRCGSAEGPAMSLAFYQNADNNRNAVHSLVNSLGGKEGIAERYGAVFAGIPAADRDVAGKQLQEFMELASFDGPVVDYRMFLGEYGAVSATAAVLAVAAVQEGVLSCMTDTKHDLQGRGIALIGFGKCVSAVEVIGG